MPFVPEFKFHEHYDHMKGQNFARRAWQGKDSFLLSNDRMGSLAHLIDDLSGACAGDQSEER